MAEPLDQPSTSPLNPKPLTRNKRKPITTKSTSATPPPPKRPHKDPVSSNSDETKDTASCIPENQEDDELLLPDDLEVYHELEDYEIRYGGNPAQDRRLMQRFCLAYYLLGIGNKAAWEGKIRRLRNKFKDRSEQLVSPDQMEEFLLWKKMFERVPPDDACSRVS